MPCGFKTSWGCYNIINFTLLFSSYFFSKTRWEPPRSTGLYENDTYFTQFFRHSILRKHVIIKLHMWQIAGWCNMAVCLSRGDKISFESYQRQLRRSSNLHNREWYYNKLCRLKWGSRKILMAKLINSLFLSYFSSI